MGLMGRFDRTSSTSMQHDELAAALARKRPKSRSQVVKVVSLSCDARAAAQSSPMLRCHIARAVMWPT